MAFPSVFISSTYLDLVETRNAILSCFNKRHFNAVSMERGGISYDHNKPMDYSCYEAVKDCDMMVLVIGSRYGSAVSDGISSTDGRTINSITKQEYLQARAVGIKILTFVKQSVIHEYYTYTNQPLAQQREIKNIGVLFITPDRGLTGGLNSNLMIFMMKKNALYQKVN